MALYVIKSGVCVCARTCCVKDVTDDDELRYVTTLTAAAAAAATVTFVHWLNTLR